MPDQPVDLAAKVVPPDQRTEFTPEEQAEFDAFLAQLDRKLDELHANADRMLIRMGLTP